jgi:apolipoprotein N-acyltransferase
MVSLKVLVVFFFAQFINCGLFSWIVVDLQQGLDLNIALKVLLAYNAIVFVAYSVTLLFLCIANERRSTSVLMVEPLSLDIEEGK